MLLLDRHILVVGHNQVMGTLHEAGEFALGIGTEQVGTCLGDEDIILACPTGFLDEEEFVTRLDNDSTAVHHLERNFDHRTATGVDITLIADEIAHAVNQQHVLVMLLAVAHLHGFNNMRMTADDEIDTLRDKPIGKGALRGNWLELIFNAPMQIHADGMCTPLPCFSDIGRNEFLIDEIDHNIALNGDAVGAIGIVQKSDFHVLDGDDVRDDFVTLLLVTIGADVRNPHRIKRLASAHQSLVAAVQTMIVGCEEKIKPHVTQLLGIAVGACRPTGTPG